MVKMKDAVAITGKNSSMLYCGWRSRFVVKGHPAMFKISEYNREVLRRHAVQSRFTDLYGELMERRLLMRLSRELHERGFYGSVMSARNGIERLLIGNIDRCMPKSVDRREAIGDVMEEVLNEHKEAISCMK
jgi:hypothetical protein